jgi:2,5-dihydroxypyridine 5,6-dioxygenase
MVNIYPIEGRTEGHLGLNGTLTFAGKIFVLERPIQLEIRDGRIATISRETQAGQAFDDWLRSLNDPASLAISHVGFGVDPRAELTDHDAAAFESLMGGVIVAFGSNIVPKYGGVNKAAGHADSVLRAASLAIDGRTVIERGQFTVASGITP